MATDHDPYGGDTLLEESEEFEIGDTLRQRLEDKCVLSTCSVYSHLGQNGYVTNDPYDRVVVY